jgi:hypothetical protein
MEPNSISHYAATMVMLLLTIMCAAAVFPTVVLPATTYAEESRDRESEDESEDEAQIEQTIEQIAEQIADATSASFVSAEQIIEQIATQTAEQGGSSSQIVEQNRQQLFRLQARRQCSR